MKRSKAGDRPEEGARSWTAKHCAGLELLVGGGGESKGIRRFCNEWRVVWTLRGCVDFLSATLPAGDQERGRDAAPQHAV
jgi:hypothetical protein